MDKMLKGKGSQNFAQTFHEFHHILSEKFLKIAFQIEKNS